MQESISEVREVIRHNAESGGQVERIFHAGLRRILPRRIGVTSGFVIDSRGKVSKQLDVILYDEENTPVVFNGIGISVIPVECTYCCGEIKTVLNRRSLNDSFDKCISYKALVRGQQFTTRRPVQLTYNLYGDDEETWPSLFFVLSVESMVLDALREVAVDIEASKGLSGRDSIDVVFSLDGPSIINADTSLGASRPRSIQFTNGPGLTWAGYPCASPWALFCSMLLTVIVQAPMTSVNVMRYQANAGPF